MQQTSFPNDPLLWDFDLPLAGLYYPLGFPLEIATNSAKVLMAAEESWGMFRKIFSVSPLQIRIAVLPGDSGECPPQPVCRGQRNLITSIADDRNYMALDIHQGFAFGWVTENVVRNSPFLRYHFLEGTAWILLEGLHLTSVHAACVQLDGHGILLCGDGGAGKSSLAYACAKNGWTFLTDDSSCLVRKRGGRLVTGNPYQMRFRDSATDLYPELGNIPLSQRLSGELSIELPMTDFGEIAVTTECFVDYIVFLNRFDSSRGDGLFRFPKYKALQWLEQVVCYGEKCLRDEHRAALRALVTADVFEMRYQHMDSALSLLQNLVHNGPSVAQDRLVTAGDSKNG